MDITDSAIRSCLDRAAALQLRLLAASGCRPGNPGMAALRRDVRSARAALLSVRICSMRAVCRVCVRPIRRRTRRSVRPICRRTRRVRAAGRRAACLRSTCRFRRRFWRRLARRLRLSRQRQRRQQQNSAQYQKKSLRLRMNPGTKCQVHVALLHAIAARPPRITARPLLCP